MKSITKHLIPPSIQVLNVNSYRQQNENWCWAASFQMLMNYCGVDKTQDEIVKSLDTNHIGPSLQNRDNYFTILKSFIECKNCEHSPLTWEELKKYILSLNPIISDWRYFDSSLNHTVVIRGYAETNLKDVQFIVLNDPFTGKIRLMTYTAYTSNNDIRQRGNNISSFKLLDTKNEIGIAHFEPIHILSDLDTQSNSILIEAKKWISILSGNQEIFTKLGLSIPLGVRVDRVVPLCIFINSKVTECLKYDCNPENATTTYFLVPIVLKKEIVSCMEIERYSYNGKKLYRLTKLGLSGYESKLNQLTSEGFSCFKALENPLLSLRGIAARRSNKNCFTSIVEGRLIRRNRPVTEAYFARRVRAASLNLNQLNK